LEQRYRIDAAESEGVQADQVNICLDCGVRNQPQAVSFFNRRRKAGNGRHRPTLHATDGYIDIDERSGSRSMAKRSFDSGN
jgi:hypothetical protein